MKKVTSFLVAVTQAFKERGTQKNTVHPTQRAVHESLEPRVLFSADIAPASLLASTADPNPSVQVSQQDFVIPAQRVKQGVELVVLDSRVENIAVLLGDIASQQEQGRPLVLIEVNAEQDGIAAITAALEQAKSNNFQIQALHIISHGRAGEFDLGKLVVNQEFIRQNAAIFAAWASGFSDDGDVLIYGCNFAQSSEGQALAQSIAALTGADVAANLQATGDLALGGDWLLEYQTGAIEAQDAISSNAQQSWHELLQIVTSGVPQVVGTAAGNSYSAGLLVGVATIPNQGTYTTGGRSVAIDKNGNFAVVWTEEGVGIKVQAYFADGALRGAETNIGNYETPSIAMTETGEFVVAYADINFPTDKKIWVQRFSPDGSLVGTGSVVSETFGLSARRPSIAINNNKQYAIAWEEINTFPFSSRPSGIYASAFRWDGSAIISAPNYSLTYPIPTNFQSLRVDTGAGLSEARPAIAISNDHVYVTWGSANALSQYDVMLRSFSISAPNYSNVVKVNTTTGLNNVQPDIASNASGRIVVAWQAGNGTYEAIRYRLFDDAIAAATPQIAALPLTPSDMDFGPMSSPAHQALPKVSMNADGSFFIVEQDGAQNSTDLEIFGRQFNANGLPVGPAVAINNVPTDPYSSSLSQFGAGIATRGQYAVMAWNTVPQNGSDFNVLVRTATISGPSLVTSALPSSITEGQFQSLAFHLSEPPLGTVKFYVTVDNPAVASVAYGTLTFNETNWNVDQLALISAVPNPASLDDFAFHIDIVADPTNDGGFADVAPIHRQVIVSNTDPVHEIVVNTTDDTVDGADVSSLQALMRNKGLDDHISLREAILAANSTPNPSNFPTKIRFDFNMALGILPTINVDSALPSVQVPVEIDGAIGSSAGYVALSGNPTSSYGGLGLWGGPSGTAGASGSVIKHLIFSNFGEVGISVSAANVLVEENFFGLAPSGLSSLSGDALGGNKSFGILVFGDGVRQVGGNTISNNFISNNNYAGIKITASNNNVVSGNVIGLGTDGVSSAGNAGVGIFIGSEIPGSTLQTLNTKIQGNTIVANTTDGILLHGVGVQNTIIEYNNIGTDSSGASGLSNIGNGIQIDAGAGNTHVLSNTIANNVRAGIKVVFNGVNSTSNEFELNRIFNNQQLEIDLATFDFAYPTPTPNDAAIALDSDTGSNNLTNFPELTNAFPQNSGTRIQGVLHAEANTTYRIEAYSASTADSGGRGQAGLYLGQVSVVTDAFGFATIDFLALQSAGPGEFVSATATRLNGGATLGDTSELSQAIVVSEPLRFLLGATGVYSNENVVNYQVNLRNYLNDPTRTGWKFSLDGVGDDIFATVDEDTGILTVNTADYEYLTSAVGGGDSEWWFHAKVTNQADTSLTSPLLVVLGIGNVNEQASVTDQLGNPRSSFTVAEDSVIVFTGFTGIQIQDPDVVVAANNPAYINNPSNMEVSIWVVNESGVPSGFLAIGDTSLRTAFTDTAIVLRGTQDALNAALLTLQLQPALNDTSPLKVYVSVDDFGSGIVGQSHNPNTSVAIISFATYNDAPTISGLPSSVVFVEGMNAVQIAPMLSLSDVDNVQLQGASIKILGGYVVGEDSLSLLASAVLPSSMSPPVFSSITGELFFIGSATISEYEALLRSVTFNNSAVNPDIGNRSIRFSVYDGNSWSAVPNDTTVQVAAVNSAPVLSGPASIALPYLGTFQFSSLGVSVDAFDVDAGTSQYLLELRALNGGLLTLNSQAGLALAFGSFSNSSSIVVSGNIAAIQNALRQLDYVSVANVNGVGNNTGQDEIRVNLTQLGLALNDPSANASSLVIPVLIDSPIAPTISLGQSTFTFVEAGRPILVFSGISLTAGTAGVIRSASVSIAAGAQVGIDQLSSSQPLTRNLTVSVGAAGDTIEIVGNGSAADYEAILQTVTFANNSANPTNSVRQISLIIDDGSLSADMGVDVTVMPVNNPPSLAGLTNLTVFEDSTANVLIPSSINVSDPDSTALTLRMSVQSGALAWELSSIQPSGVMKASPTEFVLQGTQAEIMGWASKITYTPTVNFSGVVDVRWDLADDASTVANVLVNSSINVAAVNDEPIWVSNNAVSVEQGKSVLVSAANSSATDVEELADTLSYQLTALPQHGQVVLSGRILALSDSFTQADIDSGRIEYRHNDDLSTSDQFNVVVRDSQGASTPERSVNIAIASRTSVFVVPAGSGAGNAATNSVISTTQVPVANGESVTSVKATGDIGGDASGAPPPTLSVGQSNANRSAAKASSPGTTGSGTATTPSASLAGGGAAVTRSQDLEIQDADKPASRSAALSNIAKRDEIERSSGNLEFGRLRTTAENAQYSDLIRKLVGDAGFVNDVQKVRDDANKSIKFDAKIVASTTAVSAGISIGYVIWLVRGGALLSSLLASLPAWQLMDPLPVLGSMGGDDSADDDESLDEMIKKSRAAKTAALKPAATAIAQ